MGPKISIIVPVYKVEQYLGRCIHSIFAQTFTDYEVILVDDGSPDKCPEMCDQYVGIDNRVRVIHKQNEGLGMARNSGLDIADGEYVVFIDSDDWMDPEQCELLYSRIVSSNCDFALCGYKSVSDTEVLQTVKISDKVCVIGGEALLPLYLTDRINMSVWHGIYRRSFIEANGLRFLSEREVVSEDITFSIRAALCASSVLLMPEPLQNYFKNPCSITSSFQSDRFRKLLVLYQELRTYFSIYSNTISAHYLSAFFILRSFDILAIEYKRSPKCRHLLVKIGSDEHFRANISLKSLSVCPFTKRVVLAFIYCHCFDLAYLCFVLRYLRHK